MTAVSKIHFHAAETAEGASALADLSKRYGQTPAEDADIIVALGGDGTLLETLHQYYALKKPFYGMNRGSVGFMMNPYRVENLGDRLDKALNVALYPLQMNACDQSDNAIEALAFNEVSLLRQVHHAAKITITVDGVKRLEELIADGVLVSTPAGSTAYNFSAHGPILPLRSNVLALTPISPFRPRHWRGALLPSHTQIRFDIRDGDKRPVSATADFTELRDVKYVDISQSNSVSVNLLFDPNQTLEERILKEQFQA